MKLCDGVWTLSALNSNSFGPSVLVNLLLRKLRHVDKLNPEVAADFVTLNTCSSSGEAHFQHCYATLPLP